MEFVTTQPGVTYNNLIGGTAVNLITKNVTLKGVEAEYTPGTLLALNAGKYELVGTGKVANVVLAEKAVLTGVDVVATVYVAGMFNREAIVVADDDNVDAHEEELRDVGILLTSAKQ